MIKASKYILQYPVLLLIVLHAFIPHAHAIRLSSEEHIRIHKKSHSFLGLVNMIFHEKHEDNLHKLYIFQSEEEEADPGFYDNHQAIFIESSFTNGKISSAGIRLKVQRDYINILFFGYLNDWRGPPVL